MIYQFSEWLKVRKDEAARHYSADMGIDPFIHIDQKANDFVYFGVHDLAKYYKENGVLPRSLDPQTIFPKMGRISDADPVRRTITIQTEKDPFHYGYKKLTNKDDRQKDRESGIVPQVTIPLNNLEKITHMLGTGAVLSGQNLWLVVDGNTKHQQKLMQEIRKKEIERMRPSVGQTPPESDLDPAAVDRARAWLMSGHEDEQPQPTAASVFGNDAGSSNRPQAFKIQGGGRAKGNASAIPIDPAQMRRRNQQRQGNFDPFGGQQPLDTASHDPSIISYGWAWKSHDDIRRYDYFGE